MTRLADTPLTAALAVVPCNDLPAAKAFWARLGLEVTADHGEYVIVEGHGTEVHLTRAVEGWLSPGRNPFGVYLRLEDVDALAERFGAPVIHPPKAQPWGMYEFAVNGPDDLLVRIGWPSSLRRAG